MAKRKHLGLLQAIGEPMSPQPMLGAHTLLMWNGPQMFSLCCCGQELPGREIPEKGRNCVEILLQFNSVWHLEILPALVKFARIEINAVPDNTIMQVKSASVFAKAKILTLASCSIATLGNRTVSCSPSWMGNLIVISVELE